MRARYEAGATADELAREMGVTNVTVLKRLRALGVAIRPPRPRTTFVVSDKELHAEYEAGASTVQLARKYGVSTAIVARRLRSAGALRPLARSDLDREALRAEYEAGATLEALAAKHGAGAQTIARRILAAGGVIRERHSSRPPTPTGTLLSPADLTDLRTAYEAIGRILARAEETT